MSTLRPLSRASDCAAFFRSAAAIFGWDGLEGKVVMDIGCGQGNSSKTFATTFPAIKRLIGVDYVPGRLEDANVKNSHPKIEYEQADISNKFTIARWVGEMDVVISIFCFNCLTDQKESYENLFRLLKPKGQAAILQSLHSNYYDFLKDLSELPRWSSYRETIGQLIPESHYQKYTAVHYRKLFEEIGFVVVECTDETRTYTYTSDAECRDALFQTCPLGIVVPEDRKEEFKSDVFETFLKHSPKKDDRLLCLTYSTISVLLQKPADSEGSGESE